MERGRLGDAGEGRVGGLLMAGQRHTLALLRGGGDGHSDVGRGCLHRAGL
jgi:hypothetical protein